MCGTDPRLVPDLPQRCLHWSHSDFTGGVDFRADGLHGGFILWMCNTAEKSFATGRAFCCGWANISSVPISVSPFFFPPVLSVSTAPQTSPGGGV